tara:strand:- start:277 stop:444 length:168 start_codon:yes stop_codon:yes gene_type:complete
MKYFKELLNLMGIKVQQKRRVLWLEVPMDCISRLSKDEIILSTISTLEQKIKINK